jgi:hypothetical protein
LRRRAVDGIERGVIHMDDVIGHLRLHDRRSFWRPGSSSEVYRAGQ